MTDKPLITEYFSVERIRAALDAYIEPLQLRGELGSAEPGIDIRIAEGLEGAACLTIRLDFNQTAPRILLGRARKEQAVIDAAIAAAARTFLREISTTPSGVMDALNPRPRAGTKQRAQAAFTLMLDQIHTLRTAVWRADPPALVGSATTKQP